MRMIAAVLLGFILVACQGPAGAQGPQGVEGSEGPAGPTPSETQLRSLINDIMTARRDELRGPAGPKGDTGAKGDKGEPGPEGAPGPVATASTPRPSGLVLVLTATEFRFDPVTIPVSVGQEVTLVLVNSGAVVHAFTSPWASSALVDPGRLTTVRFAPQVAGTFRFSCSVPGHEAAGMKGEIKVS